MTDVTTTMIRAATTEEREGLVEAGFRDVGPGLWAWRGSPDSRSVTTDDALRYVQWLSEAAPHGRSRRGFGTTEFWVTLAVVAPAVTGGITAAAGVLGGLPPPWNVVVGGVLTGIGAGVAALYVRARTELKRRGLEG